MHLYLKQKGCNGSKNKFFRDFYINKIKAKQQKKSIFCCLFLVIMHLVQYFV